MVERYESAAFVSDSGGGPRVDPPVVKVLLAEDHEEMRAVLSLALRAAGLDVVEVSHGRALCEELARAAQDDDNPRDFDVVVSDVCMPGVSGLEALAFIRRTHAQTPVVLMTAFGDEGLHAEAARQGAARVFDKPLPLGELVAEVLRLAAAGMTTGR